MLSTSNASNVWLANPHSSKVQKVNGFFFKSYFPSVTAETEIRRDLYGPQEVRKLAGAW